MNVLAVVLCVILYALLIFAAGLFVEFVRNRLAALMGIPSISKRIVTAARWLLDQAESALN